MSANPPSRGRGVLTVVLCLALVGASVGAAVWLWQAPPAQPEEKTVAARTVRTMPAVARDVPVKLTGWGTVLPARELTVRAQVEGRVVRHHPALASMGQVAAGDPLVALDPADYKLAIRDAQAALEEARFERDLERARGSVAEREWKAFGEAIESDTAIDPAVALRKPHLRRVRALMDRAEQRIAAARLGLARTEIAAPFPAVVLSEGVEVGQLLRPGDAVCTLAGTEAFWVRVALPMADLPHLKRPHGDEPGAAATVFLDRGDDPSAQRQGAVVRLLADLEPEGRMARVLVEVRDPLADPAPLLLGSYARVEIEAGTLDNVLELPREALREGDVLWLVGADGLLVIRPTTLRWRHRDSVLVTDVTQPGEQIVVAGLKVALPGMKVTAQPIAAPVSER